MEKKRAKSATTPGLDTLAARIAERWQSSSQPLSIDRISSEFSDVPRYDIVAALRALEKAGSGAFAPSRTGQRPSFVWSTAKPKRPVKSKRAAKAKPADPLFEAKSVAPADGTTSERGTPQAAVLEPPERSVLEHRFHLRSGFIATLALPTDVTVAEVERMCRFLRTIPFETERANRS